MLTTTSGPVVRKDLIEAAGYKVEDLVTIDDWTEVMTALQKNGVEHPLSFESQSYMLNMMPGAWGFRSGMYVNADDGKVHYGTYGRMLQGNACTGCCWDEGWPD